MSTKKHRVTATRKPPIPQRQVKHNLTTKHVFHFVHIPVWVITFLLLWIYTSFIYGDVFYICEQNTYVAFDRILEKEILDLWYGPLTFMGRFFLLSYKMPLLGGLLLSVILTAVTWLATYCFRLPRWYKLSALILPYGFLFYLAFQDLNVFYHDECGNVFSYSVCTLILLLIAAAVIRIKTKRPIPSPFSLHKEESARLQWAHAGCSLLLFALLAFYAVQVRANTILTARLQHLMQDQKWDEMIELGVKAKQPTRPICAYYSVACAQTNQITTKLFDIYYQYPKFRLYNKSEDADVGTNYYQAECNFYAGLVCSSYHFNMEQVVIEGLNVYRFKYMALACLVQNEIPLAEKYLNLIDKMPFESAFVNKYRPYLYNRKLVLNDPNLAPVFDVLPVNDEIEQKFTLPMFLGYYTTLMRGRSTRALVYSLSACLYTKDLPGFMERISAYQNAVGQQLPRNFEECLMLYEMRTPETFKIQNFDAYIVNTTRDLLNAGRSMPTKDSRIKGRALRDTYIGSYPFYYFYENVPDENYPQYLKKNIGNGKVN